MTPEQKRAFVRRMAAARAKRGKFARCVRKVKRRRGGKRVRDARAVCAVSLRKRRRNPSRYATRGNYIVVAQKRGGKPLVLVEGYKFTERGKAIVFGTERAAAATAHWLRRVYPVLKGYNPHAAPRR